jgi:hypothetical protein
MVLNRIGRVKPKTIRKLLDLATDHADGEEVVNFSKRKPEEEEKEVEELEEKEEDKQKLHSNNLVATTDKRSSKSKTSPLRDHFEKMLEAPYPYHDAPVKHAI